MFSLIISVIAIALVVLLTAATFYYGGDAMTDGKKQADAAGLINQAQQISAAFDLYLADNPSASSANIADLAPQYLTSVPEGWITSSEAMPSVSGYVAYPIPGDEPSKIKVCEDLNKRMGIVGPIPQCTAVTSNFAGCCTGP